MRILFLTPYFYPALAMGGTPRAVYELGKALVRLGHSVEVLTTDILSGEERIAVPRQAARIEGMKVHYLKGLPPALALSTRIFTAPGVKNFLKANLDSFDFVHLHEFRTFLNADFLNFWLSERRPPFGISAHGGASRELGKSGLKKIFDRLWGERLLDQAAFLFAVSGLEEKAYLELGARPGKIKLLFNGISPDFRGGIEPDPRAFREKFGLGDRPFALFLGRMNRIKGLDFLVESFARIENPRLQLVLAGPDDGFSAPVSRLVKSLNLEDRVHLLPFLSEQDKYSALASGAMTVLPSRYEIFGLSLLESLMMDKPIITTDRCGLGEYLQGKPGVEIVTFADQTGLEQAIRRTFERGEGTGETKAYCLEHFAWENIAKDYLQFIA